MAWTMTWTISDIKRETAERGYFWFEPSSMRFFRTRILGDVHNGPGGIYFVTSEKPPNSPRRASVRRFDPETCNISTVGDFCSLSTREAHKRAAMYAADKVAADLATAR